MGNYVLRPKAVDDLESIWDYTVNAWSEEQAERYIRLLNSEFKQIAEDPTLGRRCDEIREGYRKRSVGHHMIFYRLDGSDVDVVRVLHERMDFGRHV